MGSCELESMPRVEAWPYSLEIRPPAQEQKGWRFDLLKGRVIIDHFNFEAPINAEDLSMLRVRLNQRLMNVDERRYTKALGRMASDKLHFLRNGTSDIIDESVSTAYKLRLETEEANRKKQESLK